VKQKRNNEGLVEYEALQRIDKLLNNIPSTEQQVPHTTSKRVTFDKIVQTTKGNTVTQQSIQQ
jgi:hypothetical protein